MPRMAAAILALPLLLLAAPAQAARCPHAAQDCAAPAARADATRLAAHRKRNRRVRGRRYREEAPPAVQGAPRSGVPASSGRPLGASPGECYMDEGYGRYRPCTGGGDPN